MQSGERIFRKLILSLGCWAALVLPAVAEEAPGDTADPPEAAAEKEPEPVYREGLLLASLTSNPKVYTQIEGAKKTVLACAREWEYGLRLYTVQEWKEKNQSWGDYYAQAMKHADDLAAKVKLEFVRDYREVIQYAIVENEDDFLSSVLLSEAFVGRFEKELGSPAFAIVPDRHTIYLFPAVGGQLRNFGESLAEKYQDAKEQVSLEIFEVSKKGLRVIGQVQS